jgi:DNA-binding beta-propeller fold protein YncE
MNSISGVALDSSGNYAYVTDPSAASSGLYRISLGKKDRVGTVLRVTPTGALKAVIGVALDSSGLIAYTISSYGLFQVSIKTGAVAQITCVPDCSEVPGGIAISPDDQYVYITDADSQNKALYKVKLSTGIVSRADNSGTLSSPAQVTIDANGMNAFVTDDGALYKVVLTNVQVNEAAAPVVASAATVPVFSASSASDQYCLGPYPSPAGCYDSACDGSNQEIFPFCSPAANGMIRCCITQYPPNNSNKITMVQAE